MSNIGGVGSTDTQYKYSNSAASASTGPSMQDFMMLVVAQMQNQDMFSEQDNSQFMAQMAQMASMQAMQDLTTAFMSSMAMTYIGKYAKASAYAYDSNGSNLQSVSAEGYVNMVNFNGGKAMVLIGDVWFNVSDVYEVSAAAPEPEKKKTEGGETE